MLSSTNSKYARALIRLNSSETRAYSIGEEIENTDAKIHSVEGQRVILERGGKYESLPMDRVKLNKIEVQGYLEPDNRQEPGETNSQAESGSVPF